MFQVNPDTVRNLDNELREAHNATVNGNDN